MTTTEIEAKINELVNRLRQQGIHMNVNKGRDSKCRHLYTLFIMGTFNVFEIWMPHSGDQVYWDRIR